MAHQTTLRQPHSGWRKAISATIAFSPMVLSDQRGSLGRGLITVADAPPFTCLPPSPFRRFNSSPEVIRLVVMMYVRFPLSLRDAEDLLFERGIDVCHETVRMSWNRFGPLFAGDIRRQRVTTCAAFVIGGGTWTRCT